MSLKTDYFDGANGFNTKMNDAFVAGQGFVTTNLAALTTSLQENAAKGLKTFTVNYVTTFEPANLRLNGIHQQSYFSGIKHQLGTEEIYDYEITLTLNTSDNTTTSIDFTFAFCS